MAKTLVVANWKCNPTTLKEARWLFNAVKKGIKNTKGVEVVICPPFIYLPALAKQHHRPVDGTKIIFGAQNCFWEEKGPYTGEVSPAMLRDLGCKYVIVGHSERRKIGETDEVLNKKLKAVLLSGLRPILCIGETLEERRKGKTFEVLGRQLKKAINNTSGAVVAYEPVWAIGTGRACNPKDAESAGRFIRKRLSHRVRVLYGGSVNSKNAADYICKAGFDGLLVGGASLRDMEFIKIVKVVALQSPSC